MQRLTAADELTQWVTSEATVSFTYASDGCLSTKSDGSDTWTYVWDYERRLKAFKKNGSTLVEYAYNPTGTRRQASDATLGVTNYFYHGSNVLAEYDSDWSLKTSFVRLPDCLEIVGMLDRTADPTPVYYFAKDGQMSTRELLNASENVVTRYLYDAWGDPTETKLVGNRSTQFQFYSLMYDLRSGAYLSAISPFDPQLGRLLNSVGIRAVTQLMACVSLAGPVDWRDSWWWFCASGDNDTCCSTNYEKCKSEEGEQVRDPLILPEDPSVGGDGIRVVVWPLMFGRGDSCAKKYATCQYWWRLKISFGNTAGGSLPGSLANCVTSNYDDDGSGHPWDNYCHGHNWLDGHAGQCRPYVKYWYQITNGWDDKAEATLYEIWDVCKSKYGPKLKWFNMWGPDFHTARDLFDYRDGTWRYNPPAGVIIPWLKP